MGQSPNSKDYLDIGDGVPFLQGNAEFGPKHPIAVKSCNTASKLSIENDILLSVRAPVGAVNISNQIYGIGRGLCAIRSKNTPFKYLYYLALALNQEFHSLQKGSTFKAIIVSDVENTFITVPPDNEIIKIINFLDQKTSEIDSLIANKKGMVNHLQEYRQSIISETVTKGLDPSVEMKDSGIEWIGEIPRHWEVKKLKYWVEFLNYRRIPISASIRGDMEKIYPYYGASGIIDYVDNYIFDEPLILIAEDGANLISRSTPLAFIARGKYWVNNHAHILRIKNGNIEYWEYLLENMKYNLFITGSAQPKLSMKRISKIEFVAPSNDEQNMINDFLRDKTNKLDLMVKNLQDQIINLKEYRQALISEAVTGKIDVRNFKINKN